VPKRRWGGPDRTLNRPGLTASLIVVVSPRQTKSRKEPLPITSPKRKRGLARDCPRLRFGLVCGADHESLGYGLGLLSVGKGRLSMKRRDFLSTAAAAVSAPYWVPSTALAAEGKPGPTIGWSLPTWASAAWACTTSMR